MKGLVSASDLYAPARATYADGSVDPADWATLLNSVGNQKRRLWFLGDRLLDRLEARMLRDQTELPPGLTRLVDEYRSLFLLKPRNHRWTFQAHEDILNIQGRLTVKVYGAVE